MPTAPLRRSIETKAFNECAEYSEKALLQESRKGNLAAFDELIRRHQARVYATIYHMTFNREDADDLTQETFIKAYRSLKSFKGDSAFYTWIYRIAVNKTINFLKQRRRKFTHLSLNESDPADEGRGIGRQFVSEHTPRRGVQLKELQDKLNEALQKLSEIHRLVVTLHDIQGMPHDEIGKIMDCNTGTVRSRLFYARRQLQAYLSDYLKK